MGKSITIKTAALLGEPLPYFLPLPFQRTPQPPLQNLTACADELLFDPVLPLLGGFFSGGGLPLPLPLLGPLPGRFLPFRLLLGGQLLLLQLLLGLLQLLSRAAFSASASCCWFRVS